MLSTAAILMSLGTNSVKVPHVSSDRIDAGHVSFAESFDEGSALADQMQAQSADGKILKAAIGKTVVPKNEVNVAAVLAATNVLVAPKLNTDVSADGKIPNKFNDAKNLNPVLVVKASGNALDEAHMASVTSEALVQDGRSGEVLSTPVQTEVPGGQPSSTALKEPSQSLPAEGIDITRQDTSDVTALAIPPISDVGEKPVLLNQKAALLADKGQETVPGKKIAKNHDGDGKVGKATKTEKPIGTIAGAVGIQPQVVAVAPSVAVPASVQPLPMNSAPENKNLSASVPAVAGRTIGAITVESSKTDKTNKDSSSAEKIEGVNTKAAVSPLSDDSASRKSETDATKTAAPIAPTIGAGVAKGESAGTFITTTGPTHAEQETSRVVPEGIATAAAAHVVGIRSSTTETVSHAATLQSGSSAIDTPAPLEEMHKTLMATPTTLEVGIANGAHGWLKIRAEMTGGGAVNASLSTASSSGQEMLHRELPSLTAYLQNERVAVNAVVVQPATAVGADSRGLTGGMNGNGSGQAQYGDGQRGENRQDATNAVLNTADHDVAYNELSGIGGDGLLPQVSYASGGSWLSVRA